MAKAGNFFRKAIKFLLITLNLLVVLLFLLACVAPYVNPNAFKLLGLLPLGVPYLIIALIFSFFFWLAVKPKYVFIPLLALAIGYQQIRVLIGTNFSDEKLPTTSLNSLKIVDWNVHSLTGISKNIERKKLIRKEIADAILKQHADVLCLQEFNHSYKDGVDNISLFVKEYPHYFFSKDFVRKNGLYAAGTIIFSKYPITHSGKIKYLGKNGESLIYADIKKGEDSIRIYTTHLQSFRFKERDFLEIDHIVNNEEKAIENSKGILRKLSTANAKRGVQANMVKQALENCEIPAIICGDFNDVPNSYTYQQIRGNWQDAFLKKGYGIGRTYNDLVPTLRIDYILTSPHFQVLSFDMLDEDLSDHNMLVANVSLIK